MVTRQLEDSTRSSQQARTFRVEMFVRLNECIVQETQAAVCRRKHKRSIGEVASEKFRDPRNTCNLLQGCLLNHHFCFSFFPRRFSVFVGSARVGRTNGTTLIRKRQKQDMCREAVKLFIPFALQTFGGLGDKALEFFNGIQLSILS